MKPLFEWLAMGGYSAYVWPAYGLVMVVFILNICSLKVQKNRTLNLLRHWYKRQNG